MYIGTRIADDRFDLSIFGCIIKVHIVSHSMDYRLESCCLQISRIIQDFGWTVFPKTLCDLYSTLNSRQLSPCPLLRYVDRDLPRRGGRLSRRSRPTRDPAPKATVAFPDLDRLSLGIGGQMEWRLIHEPDPIELDSGFLSTLLIVCSVAWVTLARKRLCIRLVKVPVSR